MTAPNDNEQGPPNGPDRISVLPQKRPLSISRAKTKVTRACDICKAKKAKCSGEQPCETCNRRGLDCQYETAYFRGRAPAPRRSYVSPEAYAPSPAAPFDTHTPYRALPQPRHSSQAMDVDNTVQLDVDHSQEAPSRGSPGLEVAGQYTDPTSGLSFLHRAWRRISNNESSQIMNGQLASADENQLLSCAGDKPLQTDGLVTLPGLDRCQNLLALYFDVCIATYRLLHRPTAESWLRIVLENSALKQSLFQDIGRAKTATVLSVLAIACFHEEKAKGGDVASPSVGEMVVSEADQLFNEALRLSNEETGFPRLESAQSRLIQVLYLLMSCRFNQAWYTFGHALQIISALGLHRGDDRKRGVPSHRRDYIDDQCRKRTFWVAYTLDKYLGTIFGRPRHYHDEDIDQDFPDATNDEDMTISGPRSTGSDDCHIESLVFHAKLAQIAERISREVYSIKPVPDEVRLAASHRLGAELRSWRSSLPAFLGAINPSSLIPSFRRQATALKLSYCHAVMLAHRPFLLKNRTRNNAAMRRLAKESSAECIAAARSVLEAVDRMAKEGRLFHAFWWTHYVCFCALVVVYVWAIEESNDSSTLDDRRSILDQSEKCLQHLAQATASNSPSRKYSIILQELRTEAKRKTARPIHDQTQTVKNLAAIATARQDEQVDAPETSRTMSENEATVQLWQPLFGSPIDTATPGLQNFFEDWQTTDWLHLDSSAFGPFPETDYTLMNWTENAA